MLAKIQALWGISTESVKSKKIPNLTLVPKAALKCSDYGSFNSFRHQRLRKMFLQF